MSLPTLAKPAVAADPPRHAAPVGLAPTFDARGMKDKITSQKNVPASPVERQAASKTMPFEFRRHEDQWWFVEVWNEGREVFKALVEHVFAFILLVGTLILFHYVFKYLDLSPERKEILETIDFWGIAIALVIFGLSFLYKLGASAIGNAKRRSQAEKSLKLQMEKVLANEIGLGGKALDSYISQTLDIMAKAVKQKSG